MAGKGSLSFLHQPEETNRFMECLYTILPCIFSRPEPFGEGLSLHHSLITTRRKFKPWHELSPEERKEKV
jgi:hypothetical protein